MPRLDRQTPHAFILISTSLFPGTGSGTVSSTRISRKPRGNEIAFGLTPEAYPYADKGVQTIGPLPSSLQTYTNYEAVVLSRTKSPAVAAMFIAYITTPAARKSLAATGVEP